VRVPLVVLTGFLGSGKTTLVNRLLARRAQTPQPGTLAVVVNELGAVDIDGALLAGGAEQLTRQINLPGGCVCCVLGDDLDRTLLDLVEANPELSAVVLETTGVAEPLPIAWAVARRPVADRVRLAAVVTLADATLLGASRQVSAAVDAQLAYADAVLVTKAELAGAEHTAATVEIARTLAPRAEVLVASTDEHAAWLEQVLADPPLADREPAELAPGHVHDEHCRHDHHGIASTWVEVPGVVDLEELEDQLAELPGRYVRLKGIVSAIDGRVGQDTPRRVAVHRVGLRVSSEVLDGPAGEEPGRLVALGHDVAPEPLARCVSRAIV
jgi:G3E family GTPase